MSKKDKKIEIQIADAKVALEGQTIDGFELVIGKRTIGQIVELDSKFSTVTNGKVNSFFKTLDLAVTNIVEAYNLSH